MTIIKNHAELANTPLRRQALDIIEAGIGAVLPSAVMRSAVEYDSVAQTLAVKGLNHELRGRLFVLGGGKASGAMAEVLEHILPPDKIIAGIVTCKGGEYRTHKIKVVSAGHPVPDERGVRAVEEMLQLKHVYTIGAEDTIICLLSGGASALMPCPAEGISLKEKQAVTRLLLDCGADIREINTVRKHLSDVKGGQLAERFAPAQVISLVISDVFSNDLSIIASGPTSPDTTTFQDALNVLRKHRLIKKTPPAIISHLENGISGKVPDTPKSLDNCYNHIIADNRLALEAMRQQALELGWKPCIVTAEQKGETAAVARWRAQEIMSGKHGGCNAIILGGETTPVLPAKHGAGGRNQHYAVVSMAEMRDYPHDWVVASVGTDGTDFLPDVAGAIVDNSSMKKAQALGLEVKSFVDKYDSNTLLKALGGSLVITGETGTNVGDVIIYLFQ